MYICKDSLKTRWVLINFIFYILVEFRQAVRSNSYDKVRQALNTRRKFDLEQPDTHGMTLAMVAAYFGKISIEIFL